MLSTPTLVRALAALAVSTGLLTAPGAAGASPSLAGGAVTAKADKDKDKDKDKDAQVPDAFGCHNVIDGVGSYSRPKGLFIGSLLMTMKLESTSCSDSTYTLHVYFSETGGAAERSQTIAGDDVNAQIDFNMSVPDTRPSDPTDDDAVYCVFVVGETRDASNELQDRAPDAGRVEVCTGTGATASFK